MKKKIAIILNILIITLGLLGVGIAFKQHMTKDFLLYYTNLSNLYAIIASLIYLLTINKDYKIGKILRYSSTICLMLTLLVVVLILTPILKENLFIGNYMPLYHLIIPTLSLVSLLFFEEKEPNIKSALIPTLIYGFIMIILNIFKVIEGPYPFLKVYKQGFLMSIIWIIVIFAINYLITIIINKIIKKIN